MPLLETSKVCVLIVLLFTFYAAWHCALKYLLLQCGLRVKRKKTGKRECDPLLSASVNVGFRVRFSG